LNVVELYILPAVSEASVVQVRMPAELVREVDQLAQAEYRSRSNQIRCLVRDGLAVRSAAPVDEPKVR
jgi:metal-responsive CopG/Arc/MetJ family transcriptional regulator